MIITCIRMYADKNFDCFQLWHSDTVAHTHTHMHTHTHIHKSSPVFPHSNTKGMIGSLIQHAIQASCYNICGHAPVSQRKSVHTCIDV